MKTLLLTATLMVASAVLVLAATDECTVSCEGHNPGDKVADPYNCTQYYMCLVDGDLTEKPIPCDPGSHFEAGKCQGTGECTPQCVPKDCNLLCTKPLVFIADPFDCNVYYICDASNNPRGPYHCDADKQYFNGEKCTSDESQCCKDHCTPYCNTVGTQIIDPTDCKSYYVCVEEGPADPKYHYKCDNGWNFDIASGHCTSSASCVILCGSTGSPGGGGSTPLPGCTSSMICPSNGNFPMCNYCYTDYFHCESSSQAAVVQACPNGMLFDPTSHYCLTNCPQY
ncbi:uncharacterized protein LOC123509318 [Portunus trituberculatus]|uniref:uncharacterized protein LOC123509318 n=1 Tax=Portunus trituberculatus TaxID=210409 RepID=UPI001E1CC888|nr:uncharacterized protein LOC123509318 [Portunus trituberculatus]